MKKFLVFIFIVLSFNRVLISQTEADSSAYHKGLSILNNAGTSAEFTNAATYFEGLSEEKPGQWLSLYYTGLSYVMAAQKSSDKNTIDKLLDKAQKFIDKSSGLKSGEPEIQILQAFLYQMRLLADPQNRALSFSQKADATLKKAVAKDPSNPRAYFLMGNNVYYTPPIFRGGPKNALPLFLKAKDKFVTYKTELLFHPQWGEKQNNEMIKACTEELAKN